jgi:hypothetical protein
LGQVELAEDGRIVFVFPEHLGADGEPTRVPLDGDHVATSPVAAQRFVDTVRGISAHVYES